MNEIIIGVIIGCITSAFGVYLANVSSERRRRRDEFNKAAAKFRSAFIKETIGLKTSSYQGADDVGQTNLYDFLYAALLKHLRAIEIFKPHLTTLERTQLDLKWDQYCYPDEIPKSEEEKAEFPLVAYDTPDSAEEQKARKLALQKLCEILSFAQLK
ncbi:MAG: hypothetical protein SWH78_17835 [Thermodesulfobacteriota bacterium]|nr:hypothetical protein [Thermodesulfobacteriota bacterium]